MLQYDALYYMGTLSTTYGNEFRADASQCGVDAQMQILSFPNIDALIKSV